MRWPFALLVAFAAAAPAIGEDIKASDPANLAVTIYRDPDRNGGSIELDSLGGFAVITEKRQVTIPAGRHKLRFEGVIAGIIPESAIITGLPGGVIEKNQDADLLSPSALARASNGKKLSLTRTDPATGKPRTVSATLVSAGPDGVVFKSQLGFESLRCSGLPETFRYDPGMSGVAGKPTLSVQTRSNRPVTATVTLTYLAENFDWAVEYAAQVNPDGKTLDFGGWLTLANGNAGSLPLADTKVVAGQLNREDYMRFVDNRPDVIAKCWPMQTTSDIPLRPDRPYQLVRPYIGREGYRGLGADGSIVVTGERLRGANLYAATPITAISSSEIAAQQLGDLKLYNLPWPTDVAAMQMKQVRMVERRGLDYEKIHWLWIEPDREMVNDRDEQSLSVLLRTRNDTAHGLGLPLPAGMVTVEQSQYGRPMLIGEEGMRDFAVGEKIEINAGDAPDIRLARTTSRMERRGKGQRLYQRFTITNASSAAVTVELIFWNEDAPHIHDNNVPIVRDEARSLFRLIVPAEGMSEVTFSFDRD